MKKIFKYILLVLWMSLIFWFSNQSGVDSSEASGSIVMMIISFLEKISGLTFNDSVISIMCFIIRKLAHFALYFVLGLLFILVLNEYNLSIKYKVIYTIIFCLIYACSDEIHLLGSFLSIFMIYNSKKAK